MLNLRAASKADLGKIQLLYIDAFPVEEGRLVGNLACDLIAEESAPETLSYVVESGDAIVGHIGLSPVYFRAASKPIAYILAPLAVRSDLQGQGVGKKLVVCGKNELACRRVNLLLVYGDPKYYRQFGFETELAKRFVPPFPLKYEFGWQALAIDGVELDEGTYPFDCVKSLNKAAYW